MCGVTALIARGGMPKTVLTRMTDAVDHRGPDGRGEAFFAVRSQELVPCAPGEASVALGHRRLSILDLSEAGAQPMRRGSVCVSYNGEIYNYVELRRELERQGTTFRSNSDTEVLLAAYEQWGPECFARFRGMWGLVLVDAARRQVVLSRDRLGIKPLYWCRYPEGVAVVSELKQLRHLPGVRLRPNRQSLQDYLDTGYEDSRATFFADVQALGPGTWASINLDDLTMSDERSYWNPERIRAEVRDPNEAAEAFRNTFDDAVSIHLRSDVPVGCALSGGLDSSAIAATVGLVERGSAELHTFTAEFPNDPINERPWVDRMVRAIDATPHFVRPTAEGFLRDLDAFIYTHDEPVGSLAQYAGFAVARLTREASVPVTLNGQGGDELMAGYWQSYFVYLRGLARRSPVRLIRQLGRSVLPGGNPELVAQVPVMFRRYLSRRRASSGASAAGSRLQAIMNMTDQERRVFEIREMYLPRLLKWDDRNFMAFSVEGRYPFLDHKLIELVLSFDAKVLYQNGWVKEPLRRGLAGRLPSEIVRRRTKMGFETPQDRWLTSGLASSIDTWLGGESPLFEIANRDTYASLAQSTARGGADEPGQALLRGFLADRWLRVFCG
ncbi:MAG: asparagine synthase (glutamine-hydrolyzing) [Myxococcota bacterium]